MEQVADDADKLRHLFDFTHALRSVDHIFFAGATSGPYSTILDPNSKELLVVQVVSDRGSGSSSTDAAKALDPSYYSTTNANGHSNKLFVVPIVYANGGCGDGSASSAATYSGV